MFLGATRARYADSVDGTGAFAALRLAAGRGFRAVRADASYSHFVDAGWAMQLGAQSTWLARAGPLGLGIVAGGTFNDFKDGNATGTIAAGPMVVVLADPTLLIAGITGGAARRLDSTWVGLMSGSLRWHVPFRSNASFEIGAGGTAADSLRFADLSAGVTLVRRDGRIGGVLGVRAGDLGPGLWGSVDAAWIPHPRAALELSAGRYPQDLTGFAEGLFVQAGVRLFAWGSGRPRPVRARTLAVMTEPAADGTVKVAVRLGRAAREVALAGDWNGWEPIPLARDDGTWSVSLRLAPGIYKYAIVADGEWTLPEGVAGMDDGFGGKVGLLVVSS